MSKVVLCRGSEVVGRTVEALQALNPPLPPSGSVILIKPNLVEPMNPDSGAVTRPEIVEGIIRFLKGKEYRLVVGESSGVRTEEALRKAGYRRLSEKYDVEVVNFDEREFVEVKLKGRKLGRVKVSRFVLEADYLISAAVLKEHTFGGTFALKNMMGVLEPRGTPSKSYFHPESDPHPWAVRLCDLLTKFKPDLGVVDGTTAMYGSHLHGRLETRNLTICGRDPVAVDEVCAQLLGHNSIFYVEMAKKRGMGKTADKVENLNVGTS